MITAELRQRLLSFQQGKSLLTVLTGAGISAESGIPTFRGPEGYWTVGSKVYQPQEIATQTMLHLQPKDVWLWYLYRRGVCRAAQPNAGHHAVVELEKLFGDRFLLITQNVDGLHTRAGSSPERTYKIHGDLEWMRCLAECSATIYPLPEAFPAKARNSHLSDEEWALLTCPKCGEHTRPHILLWDECYNEEHFRFDSARRAADKTGLLIVVGTTGSTNLPNQVAYAVARRHGLVLDINIEHNTFSALAIESGGYFLQGSSEAILPEITAIFRAGV